MKKLVPISVVASCIFFTACAQNLDASKIPAAAKSSFEKQYPGVAVKWEKEDGKYEVHFKQNGNMMSVLMDEKGVITETELYIRVTDLPATILAYVKEHYKRKTIKEGAKITKTDGTINYEVEVSGKDVIFDTNGKFLKKEKD
jgi:cytochrome c-type biogenesis protein CcmE